MIEGIRKNLTPAAREAWEAFEDEHDQHPGYRPTDVGALCVGVGGTEPIHPEETPSFAADLFVEPAPEPPGPTTIPIAFNLDLTKYLATWRQTGYDDFAPEQQTLESVLMLVAGQVLADRVDSKALSELTTDARRLATTTQAEVIREVMTERVTKLLDETVQPTDGFGQPKGEPTTLRARISEGIDKALTEQVTNPWGKGGRSGYDAPRATIVEWAISAHVQNEVSKAVKEAMKAAQADVVAAVQAEGAKVLTEAVGRLLK